MLFARRVGVSLIVFAALQLGMFSGSDILAKAYENTSAHFLSSALVGRSNAQRQLQESLEFSERALHLQPDSMSAIRLSLKAMSAGSASLASLPANVSDLATRGDSISILRLGQVLWDSGRAEQAIEVWRSIENVEYYFVNLGHQAYAEGNRDSAFTNYEISLAINDQESGDKVLMYTNLCDYEDRRGNTAKAIAWCSGAVEVRRNVGTLLRLGQVQLWGSGDYDAALVLFEEARDLNGDVASVHYYLCVTYSKSGELDLALQSCERGLRLAPTHQYLNTVAGNLYAHIGKFDHAFCCYLQVVEHASIENLVSLAKERLGELSNVLPVPTCDSR